MMRIISVLIVLVLSFPFLPNPSFALSDETTEDSFAAIGLSDAEKKAQQKFQHLGKQLNPNKKSSPDENYTPRSNTEKAHLRNKLYISGGYNKNRLDYKEISKNSSTVIDGDHGKLEGFYATVGYKTNYYIEGIQGMPFLEAYFQRYDALITYSGGTSGGQSLTFDDEHAEIQRFGGKLGAYRQLSKKGEAFGYLDVGRRIWYRGQNRVIQGALDYAEKYWWTYFGFGGGLSYEVFPRVSVGMEAEIMYAPDNFTWMRADLYEGGTFNLGMVLGAEAKFPIKFYLLKNLSIDVTPYFTYWEINKSTTTTISEEEYYEPYSRTHIEGILAGLTYSF